MGFWETGFITIGFALPVLAWHAWLTRESWRSHRHQWEKWSVKEEGAVTNVDSDGVKRIKANYVLQHRCCRECGLEQFKLDKFWVL